MTYDFIPRGSTAYMLPTISESLPPAAREGLARRRITAIEGQCPCGAAFIVPNREQRRRAARRGDVLHVRVEHEDGCPAATDVLKRLLP